MQIPPCPNCGARTLAINCVAKGSARAFYDENGVCDEEFTDKVWFERSRVVRCSECDKIRKDIYYDAGLVVNGERLDTSESNQ